MRHQLLKINKKNATKSERRFLEYLKKHRVPFRAKVLVEGREIDFLIGKCAVDIDNHEQDFTKNEMLARVGFTPVHIANSEVKTLSIQTLLLSCL
jgi:very-short-patch-repair endonuclease